MRRARWKRKSVRDELAPHGPTHPYEGAAGTHCRQNPEISCRLRRKYPNDLSASPHLRAWHSLGRKEDTLCSSPRCRSPSSSEGFPKGRAAARPFVSFQGGAGGNRNSPAFLFRGPGGHSLVKREYPLGFSVPKRYSSAGNSGPMWEHHITLALRTAPRYCCPSPLRR